MHTGPEARYILCRGRQAPVRMPKKTASPEGAIQAAMCRPSGPEERNQDMNTGALQPRQVLCRPCGPEEGNQAFDTGASQPRQFVCRPCGPKRLQFAPCATGPEARYILCRGRQAPVRMPKKTASPEGAIQAAMCRPCGPEERNQDMNTGALQPRQVLCRPFGPEEGNQAFEPGLHSPGSSYAGPSGLRDCSSPHALQGRRPDTFSAGAVRPRCACQRKPLAPKGRYKLQCVGPAGLKKGIRI